MPSLFPTFSAEPEGRESLRPAFPFSLHLVLALNVRKACLPYIPAFSVDPKRRDSVRLAFPISLHLVLALNVGKVFALISLHFVLALNVGKIFAQPSPFSYI